MRVVFDMDFDGGAWPGATGEKPAAFGEAWVGPLGCLNLLETALGLSGHYPSNAERALRLLPALKRTEGFWSRSAVRDALGTAQRLLQWRDDLWLAGWRGEARAQRLRQLAELTRDATEGIPDRLQEICEALAGHGADIDVFTLCEPESQISPAWRGVLAGLRGQGTEVEERNAAALAPQAAGDLGRSRTAAFEAAGDGSLQLLRTFGVLEAAEQAAAWLRSLPPEWTRLVVWPDPILDAALYRHGLPTLGAGSPRHRNALLAVLPLLLELAWEPKDPQIAAEFLQLPGSPVSGPDAWKLHDALLAWPAVGSRKWNHVLEEGQKDLATIFGGRLDRAKPYPVEEVRARLRLLNGWVHRLLSQGEERRRELESVTRQCQVLSGMLDACGLSELSASELSFMLEQSGGGEEGTHPAQAGIRSVAEPGAIAGPVDCALVWDFTLSRFSRRSGLWLSTEERDDLRSRGVEIVPQEQLARRDSARWFRPFRLASRAVLCASPRRGRDGEEEFPHPAWDEIRARVAERTLSRLEVARPVMARSLAFERHPLRAAVRPVSALAIEPGSLGPREEESYSSLDKLLRCPAAYVFEYCGGLQSGRASRLPEPASSLMRGSLAHELIKIVLGEVADGRIASAAAAGARVEALFDERAPGLVGGLFLPGMDDARTDVRNRIRTIVEDVVELCTRAGLEILGVERGVGREGLGVRVGGTVDLLLGQPLCILDFKWSGVTRRREELQRGTALQLAVYSHALREGAGPPPAVGFVIIDRRRILFAGPAPLPGAERVNGDDTEQTWLALERGFEAIWQTLGQGRVAVTGNLPQDERHETAIRDGVLTLEARCEYCPYSALCGRAFGER